MDHLVIILSNYFNNHPYIWLAITASAVCGLAVSCIVFGYKLHGSLMKRKYL